MATTEQKQHTTLEHLLQITKGRQFDNCGASAQFVGAALSRCGNLRYTRSKFKGSFQSGVGGCNHWIHFAWRASKKPEQVVRHISHLARGCGFVEVTISAASDSPLDDHYISHQFLVVSASEGLFIVDSYVKDRHAIDVRPFEMDAFVSFLEKPYLTTWNQLWKCCESLRGTTLHSIDIDYSYHNSSPANCIGSVHYEDYRNRHRYGLYFHNRRFPSKFTRDGVSLRYLRLLARMKLES